VSGARPNPETFYRDHWVEIEPERVEAYEDLFAWRPQMAPLLEAAELAPGLRVVDFGCGPGGLAVELARRVAPGGAVHGVDLNEELLERAAARAARERVQLELHHSKNERIPLGDASVDRVVCKNVLEYVSAPDLTLSEFRRVLTPGGIAHVIDSDWGLLAVEPIGSARCAALFDAAKMAYRTPEIGRRLYGAFRGAGFSEVKVKILAMADTRGLLLPALTNMAGYARASGRLDAAEIDRFEHDIRAAIEDETFLMVLPQFLVTGRA
jgi:SAM-dependent methyltransferase